MISIDNLAVQFGGTTLFSEVSFSVNDTDKIALMGKNGAGKSSVTELLYYSLYGTTLREISKDFIENRMLGWTQTVCFIRRDNIIRTIQVLVRS